MPSVLMSGLENTVAIKLSKTVTFHYAIVHVHICAGTYCTVPVHTCTTRRPSGKIQGYRYLYSLNMRHPGTDQDLMTHPGAKLYKKKNEKKKKSSFFLGPVMYPPSAHFLVFFQTTSCIFSSALSNRNGGAYFYGNCFFQRCGFG